jgi:hypothetical protein
LEEETCLGKKEGRAEAVWEVAERRRMAGRRKVEEEGRGEIMVVDRGRVDREMDEKRYEWKG